MVAVFVATGCGASPEEDVGETTSAVSTPTLNAAGTAVANTVDQVGELVGVCSPLTCCFPTGAEWDDNPFENTLRGLGCTTPQAYTEHYGQSTWWMFSMCPVSVELTQVVAEYANVAPYQSSFAVNECLLLDDPSSLLTGQTFVEFDPTCSSCRTVAAH